MRVVPGKPLPALEARTIDGARWTLAGEKAEKLVLLAFYRGAFCPICRVWLGDLERLVPEFEKRGVTTIALTCDPLDSAKKSAADWGLKRLRVGAELDVEAARAAGLYISAGRGANPQGIVEPRLFAEPGLMLAKPGGELYAAWVQSTPYARVHVAEILTAVDNLLGKNLPPARGSA
jgi:peroxiredoxin